MRAGRATGLLALAVVAGVAGFAGLRGSAPGSDEPAPSRPTAATVEAARGDVCALFSTPELTAVLGEGRFRDSSADIDGGAARCTWLGVPSTGVDRVEVTVADPARDPSEGLAAVARGGSGPPAEVPGLGEAAFSVEVGVGEVWARDGAALVGASVTRAAGEGDPDAATSVVRAVLAKLR